MEDIIGGRAEIIGEIAKPNQTRKYMTSEIGALLQDEDFVEALAGLLRPDAASQAR